VTLEIPDLLVLKEFKVRQESLVLLDQRDQPELLVLLVPLAQLVMLGLWEIRAQLVLRAQLARKGIRVLLETRAPQGPLVPKAPPVLRGLLETQEILVLQDLLGTLARLVRKANKV
jgi:hypothetical protein